MMLLSELTTVWFVIVCVTECQSVICICLVYHMWISSGIFENIAICSSAHVIPHAVCEMSLVLDQIKIGKN